MGKDKKKKKEEGGEKSVDNQTFLGLSKEAEHTVTAVIFFLSALFLILAYFGIAGIAGDISYGFLSKLFGAGFFLFPLVFILLGIALLKAVTPRFISSAISGGILFLLSSLGLLDLIFRERTGEEVTGGLVGKFFAMPFIKLFDQIAGGLILLTLVIISFIIIFDSRLLLKASIFGKNLGKKKEEGDLTDKESAKINAIAETEEKKECKEKTSHELVGLGPKGEGNEKTIANSVGEFLRIPFFGDRRRGKFTPPPLSLFENDSGKPSAGDIKANANIIKRTLSNFGIDIEMDEISIGPSITRYALKPAEGIKLSRILGLNPNLALALAAHPIRIEAPIPGKSLVGIEIPNKTKSIVGLGSLFSTPEFQNNTDPLFITLGRGVSGSPYFTNLSKAPHILIAGSTGSGKSVTIHTIIASILYRNPPDKVRFIMIDPKRVELTAYNNIPHLLTGVITDPKKTIIALGWAAKEMERRYSILEENCVRDIQSYHKNIMEPFEIKIEKCEEDAEEMENAPDPMPYIVIVIDELADIMATYPRELEAAIVRLAQMSRAVGIHLVLSTQRPQVEVITGLIKANIPTRIALRVPSQIDSRTILDTPGAEKLLGAGDMLYMGGETAKPIRIQSGYISEQEVKNLVKFLINKHKDDFLDEIDLTADKNGSSIASVNFSNGDNGGTDGKDDQIYEEAKKLVTTAGKASSSLLQRKLMLGYARAARIMDMLEERGVVGPGVGSKPREVLIHAEAKDVYLGDGGVKSDDGKSDEEQL